MGMQLIGGGQAPEAGAPAELDRKLGAAAARGREEERQRIGQTLHDGPGQMLAVALFQVKALSDRLSAAPDQARLADLRTLLQTTLDEVRALSHELRPGPLDRRGLVPALAALAATSSTPLLTVELRRAPLHLTALPPGAALSIYRVAQAALGNVIRHAGASRCTLALTEARGWLCLEIEDDGCGFDPAQANAGLGLSGMHERAAGLGGACIVESGSGGTLVRFHVPLR